MRDDENVQLAGSWIPVLDEVSLKNLLPCNLREPRLPRALCFYHGKCYLGGSFLFSYEAAVDDTAATYISFSSLHFKDDPASARTTTSTVKKFKTKECSNLHFLQTNVCLIEHFGCISRISNCVRK